MPGAGIVQRIALEGADAIEQALASIGQAGQTAFNSIAQSAGKVAPALTAVETGAKRVAETLSATSQTSGDSFSKIGTNARAASDTVTVSVRGLVSPLQAAGIAARDLGSGFSGSEKAAVAFGAALRGIGKVTGEHELSRLGGVLNLIARHPAIAALGLLAAGLGALANSGAKTTQALADTATKLKITNDELNRQRAVAAGAGIGWDKMAGDLEKLRGEMEKAAQVETEAAAQRQQALHSYDSEVNAQGEVTRSLKTAGEAATQAGNIFNQLGVQVTDTSGKLRPFSEIEQQLAQILPNITDQVKKQQVAWDLIAAGVPRQLIPALQQGTEALRRLEATGRQMVSPFTDDMITKADQFAAKEQHAADWLTKLKEGFANGSIAWFQSVNKSLDDAVAKMEKLLKLEQQIGGASGGGSTDSSDSGSGPGFAVGGYVRGPGTSTSDSILARLSSGEFVVRAAAVQHWGVGVMHAINSMRGFAEGGLVGLPSFAAGGSVPAPANLHPVSIHFGGDTIDGLLAPTEVANNLVRAATGRRVRRAGKKPSWVGA